MLFSNLIVWYMFLGGFGGGLCLSALYTDYRARGGSQRWAALRRTTQRPALVGSFISLAAGSICLIKDLALPEKALLLFIKPTFSAITIGTYALTGLLACIAFLVFVEFRKTDGGHPFAIELLRCITAFLSIVIIVYTGLLLSTMAAVPFWMSVFVPVLFVLSSLSPGIAGIAFFAAFPRPALRETSDALRSLLRMDIAIIALEIVSVLALGISVFGNTTAIVSVETLINGQLAPQFWIGFILCGLAAPIVMEVVFSSRLSSKPAFYIVLGCLILTGAFFLRYCTVVGGVHLSAFMFTF